MPKLGPIKRRELIYYLRQLGFMGPYSGGNHQFMVKESIRVRIPNPHEGDIGKNLLKKILAEAGVNREQWEQL